MHQLSFSHRPSFLSFLFFAASLLLSMSSQALVVLQYHHIDDGTPPSTSTSPAVFLQHMQLIEDLGLDVVDLESATRALVNPTTHDDNSEHDTRANNSPLKQVAISFDDAYASIFHNAYPELKRRNWPFTIFVNTNAVNFKNKGIMSWQQLQQLVDDGVTIANHTASHAHLPSIPEGLTLEQWLEKEIMSAQKELQEKLSRTSTLLAYPYGEFTLDMFPWLIERNILAFGQQSGPIGQSSQQQALPRFPAAGIYANVETLKTKLLTIALPVTATQLQDPILHADNNPPTLTLNLPKADYNPQRLQCFASQQGAIPTTINTDEDTVTLSTQAPLTLKGPRSRYNCTAPSGQRERFYWYSQPWQIQ